MIQLTSADYNKMISAARESYPFEACGLLVGYKEREDKIIITQVEKSKNITPGNQRYSFQIDPRIQLSLTRSIDLNKDKYITKERLIV